MGWCAWLPVGRFESHFPLQEVNDGGSVGRPGFSFSRRRRRGGALTGRGGGRLVREEAGGVGQRRESWPTSLWGTAVDSFIAHKAP